MTLKTNQMSACNRMKSLFPEPSAVIRSGCRLRLGVCILFAAVAASCLSATGISEIQSAPYPLLYEDDSTARFGNANDDVFIEVRTEPISGKLENLAIHYKAYFPEGESIKSGDLEEYIKIRDRNAYKVTFPETYIRKRKRVDHDFEAGDIPPGWSLKRVEDPESGRPIPVLYGPVIPRYRTLYLVEGKTFLYYIFFRADGAAIQPAKEKLDTFVHKGIEYL